MQWEIFLTAATLASFVKSSGKSFRQREVKFFAELFTTWRHSPHIRKNFSSLHNNQISRFLNDYLGLGWVKRTQRNGQPLFSLSRVGLVGTMMELRSFSLNASYEDFIFINYLLQFYKPQLVKLIESAGFSLPVAQTIEVEQILSTEHFVKARLTQVEQQRLYWLKRIQETEAMADFAQQKFVQGESTEKVLTLIENRYPYEMSYAKPITQLLMELPPELKRWEVTQGTRHRSQRIWKEYVLALEFELSCLQKLLKNI